MSEADLIERLAAAVAARIKPEIPLTIALWDIATIAEYLRRDPQVVRERIACRPDFPPAIRLLTKTGRAQPLYRATKVIEWVMSHQEKH